MIGRLEIQPRDRILLLSIPDVSLIFDLAARVPEGLIAGLGTEEEVCEVRRVCRGLDNVMFLLAAPDEVPWRERFFTKVLDPRGVWERPELVVREIARLLAPGGLVLAAEPARSALLGAGFVELAPGGQLGRMDDAAGIQAR